MLTRVRTSDGRWLAVETTGDPRGRPVLLLHGTPGSRLGPAPRGMVMYRLGVRLITYDRPGYGDSDRLPGRTVGSVVDDVAAIADALDLDRFSVVGRSGGGPHALACAALLPQRVRRAAVMVGIAPFDAEGLDWFAGMTEFNIREYSTAATGLEPLARSLGPRSDAIRADPTSLVADLSWELADADRVVVADAGVREMLVRNYAEAVRTSAAGWIDDILAFCSPWGFDPADIPVPVLLWHGEKDVFAPVSHSRWLAERIRGATAVFDPGGAHFTSLAALPEVITWLLSGRA